MMGRENAGLSGHWKDELVALKNGLKELQKQRKSFQPSLTEEKPLIAHVPIRKIATGKELVIRATVGGQDAITRVRVSYGNPTQSDYKYISMEQTDPFLYHTVIPGSEVTEGLKYFIEAVDEKGRHATYPREGQAHPIAVTVTNDNEPPLVEHTPITSAPAGKPLTISAEVRDGYGVKWVRLRYRSVTQYKDFQTMTMLPTGRGEQYQAVIPDEHINPKWDFMYLIEVMDSKGNGKVYPDLEKENPYIVVRLERDIPQ